MNITDRSPSKDELARLMSLNSIEFTAIRPVFTSSPGSRIRCTGVFRGPELVAVATRRSDGLAVIRVLRTPMDRIAYSEKETP